MYFVIKNNTCVRKLFYVSVFHPHLSKLLTVCERYHGIYIYKLLTHILINLTLKTPRKIGPSPSLYARPIYTPSINFFGLVSKTK